MLRIEALLRKLKTDHVLSKDELVEVLDTLDENGRRVLFAASHDARMERYGDQVYMRGLIEFSNICKQDCMYCGIRHSNKKAERYRLLPHEILACCADGYQLGYRTFVLQGGEDSWYHADRLADVVRQIKREFPDTAVTLSVGELSRAEYQQLFDAGANRYLLRHETASRRLYESLHPNMSFDNRIRCLYDLQDIGYQVGAGFLVGLPGQTSEDLADDLLFLHDLQPDMVGIGPFIPHHDTPLSDAVGGTVDDTLVMLALTRLVLPEALMPATTAMGSLHPTGRERALQVGCNVVMPNLSPTVVRPKYALYENKICTGDESAHCRACIDLRIRSFGFVPDMGRGDSLKHMHQSNSGIGADPHGASAIFGADA